MEEFDPIVQIFDIHLPREGASFGDRSTSSSSSCRGACGSCPGSADRLAVVGRPANRPARPTDNALELHQEAQKEEEVEVEEELEIDESIDRFEHSRFRPPLHGGALRRRMELHVRTRRTRAPPAALRGADRGRASAADHGRAHQQDRGAACGCANATNLVKIVAGMQIIPQGVRMLACPFFGGNC